MNPTSRDVVHKPNSKIFFYPQGKTNSLKSIQPDASLHHPAKNQILSVDLLDCTLGK